MTDPRPVIVMRAVLGRTEHPVATARRFAIKKINEVLGTADLPMRNPADHPSAHHRSAHRVVRLDLPPADRVGLVAETIVVVPQLVVRMRTINASMDHKRNMLPEALKPATMMLPAREDTALASAPQAVAHIAAMPTATKINDPVRRADSGHMVRERAVSGLKDLDRTGHSMRWDRDHPSGHKGTVSHTDHKAIISLDRCTVHNISINSTGQDGSVVSTRRDTDHSMRWDRDHPSDHTVMASDADHKALISANRCTVHTIGHMLVQAEAVGDR